MISAAVSARVFEKSIGIWRRFYLYGYGDASAVEDFDVIVGGRGGKSDAVFLEFVHDHLDDFVDVFESFLSSGALGDCAITAQGGAIGVIAAFVGLDNDFERVGLHGGYGTAWALLLS